jgi:acyl carrier protein
MTDPQIMERLTALVRLTFGADETVPITRETVSWDIDGWDSLSHSTLLIMAEKEFGISISPDEGEDFDNVGELADFIGSKVA